MNFVEGSSLHCFFSFVKEKSMIFSYLFGCVFIVACYPKRDYIIYDHERKKLITSGVSIRFEYLEVTNKVGDSTLFVWDCSQTNVPCKDTLGVGPNSLDLFSFSDTLNLIVRTFDVHSEDIWYDYFFQLNKNVENDVKIDSDLLFP